MARDFERVEASMIFTASCPKCGIDSIMDENDFDYKSESECLCVKCNTAYIAYRTL